MSEGKQLSTRKKALFTIILVLLPFFLVLIVGETYMRLAQEPIDLWALTGRSIGKSPVASWAYLDAFSAYRGKPGRYAAGKTVNSHGFISTPELAVAKPAGTIRVVFLGGSSTAGTGTNLADEDTWPWLVNENLKAAFPERHFEFINAALGGYTSFESYGRLWSRIRFYSPDIVVVYHAWNEMYYFDEVDSMDTWRTRPDGSWTFDVTTEPVTVYEPLAIDKFVRPSQFLTFLRLFFTSPVGAEVGESETLANDFDRRGLEIWRTNLRLLRESAHTMGAELFVAKQATLIVEGLPADEQARAQYQLHGFDHQAHVEAFREIYRVIDEEIPPDRIVDLTPLSGRPELFTDHVHPTEEGAAAIADLVAEALGAYLQNIDGE